MEKVKLNNQVVIMRKHVKQAKVHVINKLVKQVKLLQNRKGNEIHIQKAKRKAERLLEEIFFLKKMKTDDISKVALSKAKDWKNVLLQKNSSLEDRCIAMLASYGPVQSKVKIFHDSNKDLVPRISDLIMMWEEKKKLCKDLTQKKNADSKKFGELGRMQNMEDKEGSLNNEINQSAATINGKNKTGEEKIEINLLTDNHHEMETVQSGNIRVDNESGKQNSVEPSEISLSSTNLSEVPHNNENLSLKENEKSNSVEYESQTLLGSDDEIELQSTTDSSTVHDSKVDSDIEKREAEDNDSKPEDASKKDFKTKGIKMKDTGVNKLLLSKNLKFKDKSPSKKTSAQFGNENLNSSCSIRESPSKETSEKFGNENLNLSCSVSEAEDGDSEPEDVSKKDFKTKGTKIKHNGVNKLLLSKNLKFKDKSPSKKISAKFGNENLNSSCSVPMKIDITGFKSSESKLKAIALLNLDDLKDCDEILVNNSVENKESDEEQEKPEEESKNYAPQNDPFFLGPDESASVENKLVDDPKSKHCIPLDNVFERKEKSNYESSYKKNFQRHVNTSQSSGRISSEFKNEKNFKTFKKDKFMSKINQNSFQQNNRNSFTRENPKNRFQPYKTRKNYTDNFKYHTESKKNFSGTYESNKHNSNDFHHGKHSDKPFRKNKVYNEKNDSNFKPMHPSWEAKRKQKELINTTFQGKKVVFQD